MLQPGQLVEVVHANASALIKCVGSVVDVTSYYAPAHPWASPWEIVTVRVSLGRWGMRDIVTFGSYVRPFYTLAQEAREREKERDDPEEIDPNKILGLARGDPPVEVEDTPSDRERLVITLGWTRG